MSKAWLDPDQRHKFDRGYSTVPWLIVGEINRALTGSRHGGIFAKMRLANVNHSAPVRTKTTDGVAGAIAWDLLNKGI